MTKTKTTKRALFASVLSMMLCMAMLVGSTFAWFTDSVTSGKNKIVAGNLDVELEYSLDGINWTTVDENTNMFKEGALWEPGYTEVVYLQVKNVGSLALKYQFGINEAGKVIGKTADDEDIDLANFIEFGVVKADAVFADRAAAREAVKGIADTISAGYSSTEGHLIAGHTSDMLALVVYMPETIGNEANHGTGKQAPEIYMGINLVATQDTVEEDSFDPNYDANATYENEVEKFTFTNASDADAFCSECFDPNITTTHNQHKQFLKIEEGKAVVPITGAHRNFVNLNWDEYTYSMEMDVDLAKLGVGDMIAFDSGNRTNWQDIQIGFKNEEGTIKVYNSLLRDTPKSGSLRGEIGSNVHIAYIYTKTKVTATVTDGTHTYNFEVNHAKLPKDAQLYWNVYTANYADNFTPGSPQTNFDQSGKHEYAALDNVVFSVLPYDRVPDLIQEGYAPVENSDDFSAALKAGEDVVLTNDIALNGDIKIPGGVTIDGNGKKIYSSGNSWGTIANVDPNTGVASTDVTIKNCEIVKGDHWANAIVGGMTFEGCTFTGGNVYVTPGENNDTVVIENCTFNGAMLTVDFMNTTKVTTPLKAVLRGNTFNISDHYDNNKMHTGVGIALFIREDSGFYTDANSLVQITMEGNKFVNKTGDDNYCAYQIIQTWEGHLTENSKVPVYEDNTYGEGAWYSWANYTPFEAWTASVH